jgi:protein transport protein SEC31
MVEIFTSDMQRVASKAPPAFAAQVKDTQKRLNILFDHLNNEELVKSDTIGRLHELAEAIQSKNYDAATKMQVDIQREKTDECGNWMVRCPITYRVNHLTTYRSVLSDSLA